MWAEAPLVGTATGLAGRMARYVRYRLARFDRDPRLHPVRKRKVEAATASARAYFSADPSRRQLIDLFGASASTGAGWTDYHLLHRYVVSRRPSRLLEFGSGVTTLVIAHAISEIERSGGTSHLYSLEDVPRFHENVKRLLPAGLARHVTLLCAPKKETRWRDEIWGFCYETLPPGPFDFVFVDGPTERAGSIETGFHGEKGAGLDLLFLFDRQPDAVVDVIVDQKFSSLEAYQSVLPPGSVRYDAAMDVGVIARARGRDLGHRHSVMRLRGGDAWRLLGIGSGPK
jgi:hypothetical protein